MNILNFLKSLITPKIQISCDGTYNLTNIDNENDIKILINQIKLLPNQSHIDKKWIIKSLQSLSESKSEFIQVYKKIKNGKDLYYTNDPEALIKQLEIIYPNVKFNNLKAESYQ